MSFPNPRQIDALPSVSASQLLKLIDLAIAQILIKGQAVAADGRTLTRGDLDALRRTRADLVTAADAEVPPDASGAVGGVLLPRFPNDA